MVLVGLRGGRGGVVWRFVGKFKEALKKFRCAQALGWCVARWRG